MRKIKNILILIFIFFAVAASNNICYTQQDETRDIDSGDIIDKAVYLELLEDFGDIKADRDNLLIQAKKLIAFKNQYTLEMTALDALHVEVEALKEKEADLILKAELQNKRLEMKDQANEDLQKTIVDLEGQVFLLEKITDKSKAKDKIKQLEREKLQVIKDLKEKYKGEISQLKDTIKALERNHRKDNRDLESKTRSMEKDIDSLVREKRILASTVERKETKLQEKDEIIEEFEVLIKDSRKKMKDMERDVSKIPSKYRALAKQNEQMSKHLAATHYNLGVFFAKEQQFTQAIKEFEETIRLRPYDKDAIYNLGLIYAEHEIDREKAIQLLKRYLQLDNKSVNASWARGYVLRWEAWRRDSKEILR
ncbi:MAG: hypothetical protein KAI70_06065 [Candidatus Omnitrophica bacterium]|nr:hypothetical protein [Candidatus Omnitrophota bacterium]